MVIGIGSAEKPLTFLVIYYKSIFPSLQELLICRRNFQGDRCALQLQPVQRYWRALLGPGRESPCLGCCPQAVTINLLMSKGNYPSRKLEAKFPYLISFIPSNVLHFGKCLGAFHHKINEVSTPTQAAYDEDIGQNTQEPPQVDILILVAFLLIYNRLLKKTGGMLKKLGCISCTTKHEATPQGFSPYKIQSSAILARSNLAVLVKFKLTSIEASWFDWKISNGKESEISQGNCMLN